MTLGRFQLRLVCSLPIVAAGVHSRAVTPDYLESAEFATLATELGEPRSAEWTQDWSADTLGWRLAAPGARYAMHWTNDLIAASARTRARGVRVGSLMKLIARRGPVAARQVRRVVL